MSIRKWKKEFRKTYPLGWFEKNKYIWSAIGLDGGEYITEWVARNKSWMLISKLRLTNRGLTIEELTT